MRTYYYAKLRIIIFAYSIFLDFVFVCMRIINANSRILGSEVDFLVKGVIL